MSTQRLLRASIRRAAVSGIGLAGLALAAAPALAAPQGGNVVAGNATISQSGRTTTINTQTARTIIEFDSFNITNSQAVVVNQPTSQSALLNRITNGAPTAIQGQLSSNGQVYFVNPAGVSFSSTSVVNVGRLVAAGANMSDADFLAGRDNFTGAAGSIVNQSPNLFGQNGVVLVGRNVTNNGQIVSDGGAIILVSGQDVLIQEGPGEQVMVKIEGFGTTRGRFSRMTNNGTIDAGDGQVVLGAGDLLGLSVLRNGSVTADTITIDVGDLPLALSRDSSRFSPFDLDANIIVNTRELSYHCDVSPNDRLSLNAADGFTNLGPLDPDCGPSVVNGQPGPGDPGNPVDPGNPGTPGLNLTSTFVDAYARFLPVEPQAVAPASTVKIDGAQAAAFERDLGIDVKDFDEQPLLDYLVAATVLNDLAATPASGNGSGGTRVSADRLGHADAQAAIDAYGDVFYVNSIVDDVAADQDAAANGTTAGVGDRAAAAATIDNDVDATDQTQRVRSLIQQAADRYMADAEVTDIDPVEFVEWLKEQDPETLDALAGLDELVNDAMPNLGLGAAELNNFKQWTYGKIAPQGVSLRTLDELVSAAGRG